MANESECPETADDVQEITGVKWYITALKPNNLLVSKQCSGGIHFDDVAFYSQHLMLCLIDVFCTHYLRSFSANIGELNVLIVQ